MRDTTEQAGSSAVVIVLSAVSEGQLNTRVRDLLAFVEEQSRLDLVDLAFSLQVGRAALDCRLAFTADSLDGVARGLRTHLGQDDTVEVFRGRTPESPGWEEQSEEDRDLVRSLISARAWRRVAEVWAGGRAVDWARVHAPRRPFRIPLPTYPFAKERYWVAASPAAPAGSAGPSATAVLHPLPHRDTSEPGGRRYRSTFTGEELFLRDHLVQGVRTLPGAAYLEVALAAAADSRGAAVTDSAGVALSDVVWIRPFRIDDQPRDLHVLIQPDSADTVGFRMSAGGEDAETAVLCTGSVAPCEAAPASLDLARLRAACGERRWDATDVYPAFGAAGLAYGDSFRAIDHLLLGDSQVLARVVLPEAARVDADGCCLPPSLMDAAFQTCAGLMAGEPDAGRTAFVPFGVERVEVLAAPGEALWVWGRRGARDTVGGATRTFDLDLCDDAGQVQVRVRGLSVRALHPGATADAALASADATVFASPRWQRRPLSGAAVPATGGRAVVFAENGALVDGATAGPDCEVVTLSSRAATLDARYTDYAAQVFLRARQLLRDGTQTKYVLQVLLTDRPESRVLTGLGALLRTAALENPRITGQVVVMAAGTPLAVRLDLLAQERRHPVDAAVRLRGDGREVLTWAEESPAESPGSPWRSGGVYLVTGGMGGLGRVFAEEIARQAKDARLVLVGRSPETEQSRRILERLRASGAEVSYEPVDVADRAAVSALVRRIRRTAGTIHGVVHSAGVIEDDFILRKSEGRFREVLAPKVSGLVNLDEATGDLDLDFFVAFSSGAAVTGNVGQADYAAANAFMDAFAEYRQGLVADGRRSGRTLSINWPLWAEGGMGTDAGTRTVLRDRFGILPLERGAGIGAFSRCLHTNHHQVLVAAGHADRIRKALTMQRAGEHTAPVTTATPPAPAAVRDDGLAEWTVAYLTSLLSEVLKVPARRIEAGSRLERYGIDSIQAVNLTARLEASFGHLPKTLFFEYRNVKELSQYFIEAHQDRLRELRGTGPVDEALSPPAAAPAPAPAEPSAADAVTGRAAVTATGRAHRAEGTGSAPRAMEIAVIGVAGRYPQAPDLRTFWRNLAEGRDCVTEVPRDRWDAGAYYDADRSRPGTTNSKWGGFLDDVDRFDPLFFNMSPREAEFTDPQERLFLECVYETLQDAGYTRQDLTAPSPNGAGGRVGVFVGSMYDEYQLYGATEQALADGRVVPGNAANIANRVSYFCDWQGPSLTVKTMCSSSLTALHLACQSLQTGDCEVAIAGGVNLSLHPAKYLLLGQAGFASGTGRCESFGQGGDGYVPAEGVGAVMLKPLDRAVADGDRILGVIRATAVNHGGRTNGYTVPNPNAQADVVARALDRAGVDARTISYVEAHGTGTSLGDPIEIAGLTKAFSRHTDDRQFCAIGSVKSNIGHAESAAGISAFTKVLLQLAHGRLAPSLHSETLNPHIDFGDTPFRVQREPAEWRRPVIDTPDGPREYPRLAGVSSFGAGGSNAHVIVGEYVPAEPPAAGDPGQWPLGSVIVLSARTEEQLREQARRLLDWVREERVEDADVPAVAATLQVAREHMAERLAFLAGSAAELTARLDDYVEGKDDAGAYRGRGRRSQDVVSVLVEDEDMERTIAAWVHKGKFGKLLELWTNGLDLPWRSYYPNALPRRLSLPAYPFARKRFWMNGGARSGTGTAGPGVATAAEPAAPVVRADVTVQEAPAPRPVSGTRTVPKPRGIGLTPLDAGFGHSGGAAPARPASPGSSPAPQAPQAPDAPAEEADATAAPRTEGVPRPAPAVPVVPPGPTPGRLVPPGPVVPDQASLVRELAASLADALYLLEEEVDPDTKFTDIGLDSIVGVEWMNAINKRYGLDLTVTRLYDHPTVVELSACIVRELAEGGAPQGRPFREVTEPVVEPEPELTGVVEPEPVRIAEPEPVVVAEPAPAAERATRAESAAVPSGADAHPIGAIAVVGMSGRYPGSATLDEYWDNLAHGRDCVGEVPESRWSVAEHYDPRPHQEGKVTCKWMGHLDDIESFDPLFFNIPPAEAESMDPQQRLFLQEAYHAFEDAGYDPRSLSGRKCGVYLGIMSSEYGALMQRHGGETSAAATSGSNAITAARIAYFLDLKGPAIALDTACSSSLVATHLATQALRSGEIDMALVGGVTLYLSLDAYLGMSSAGMLSPDGRCKAFDNSANGFVPGEGVGALVLKRLEDAVRDRDHIHGVVIGSGINQDGRTNGITAPSGASQMELERDVYDRYGIDPAGIGYAELHGTGTKLGDPIELEALATVYREHTDRTGYCAIGSVKSNLGHTSAAAGIASIQKVLLCMRNEQLVPTLHFDRPNEHFDFESSPFRVNTELSPWKTEPGSPRRAAVSGFGFSGTNAHLVVEEFPQDAAERPVGGPQVFVLSARSEEQLRVSAARLVAHLRAHPSQALADVAHTLQQGREAMARRLAVVATTPGELLEKLTRYVEDGVADGVLTGLAGKDRAGRTEPVPQAGPDGTVSAAEAERLAAAWIGGTPVDWARLSEGALPRRVPLPTYPFARERCWFDDAPASRRPEASLPAPDPVPTAQEHTPTGSDGEVPDGTNILLAPVWDAVPPRAPQDVALPSGRVVVIGGTEEQRERIGVVHPRAEHLPLDPADTVETIAAKLDATGETLGHLVWLAPREPVLDGPDAAADALVDAQEAGLYACFRTLKALLRLGYGRRPLDVTVVTERTLRVRRTDVVHPAHAGLHGLLGSVAKEYPGWTVHLADLDPDRDWPVAQLFALPREESGSVWAYRRSRWYRQTLVPVRDTAAEHTRRAVYRQGGVYVVIGGAGGIGEAWTEHMIRAHGAQVVWIGRREEDESIRAKLSRLGELGPRPRYVRADATDRAALERAYEDIKRTHPVVHGVIHSAIVLLDQSLERMDEQRFRAAVTAKVDVSVRLAQVFRGEPLDFLLFFSSMNSFLKASGQCNYVAGSVFEDAYAHRLAGELDIPVKTMNWGYWGTVGVVAAPEYRERMHRVGAGSIEPADGMAALDVLLSGTFDQLGMIKAHGGNS
ncbi:SDR family NAD(P)-dependent oxidoreductase [Streptomyces sp. Tu 3180]|uniref:SDR family NAD(P)-dependent oxidoreductase n=1 Tax=Streptomyces sp. Tu 3180 TaxID=2682611 RepID=UPI00135AF877|nr:SDR family NAD(P)-dependent oxidoreductase [Streptomyces sp. Tu 3180]KAF3469296.1 SDR family NAD(P)-dependent oxidoreductase [Streptomyces sp. Tu 3180]